jgi:hypothetical protein
MVKARDLAGNERSSKEVIYDLKYFFIYFELQSTFSYI